MSIRIERAAKVTTPVQWRPGWALPPRFTGRVDDDDAPYVVELELVVRDRQVHCRSLRFSQREDGPPVQARHLREHPIQSYIRLIVTGMAMAATETEPGTWRFSPARDEQLPEVFAETERAAAPPRRMTDEHLAEVADVYRRARKESRAPRKAVQADERWAPVPENTAARWIRAARDRGLLDEPDKPPRRPAPRKGRS